MKKFTKEERKILKQIQNKFNEIEDLYNELNKETQDNRKHKTIL